MGAVRGRARWLAPLGAALVAMICPPLAGAAAKDRVGLSVPEAGQLSIARLQFDLKRTAKPKLKVKAKNAGELPAGLVAVAQPTLSQRNEKIGVVFLAMANPAQPAGSREERDARGGSGPPRLLVEVKLADKADRPSISFDDAPRVSRNFLSVLGSEADAERRVAQELFGLDEDEFPEDEAGGLSLEEALEILRLRAQRLMPLTGDFQVSAERFLASALAGALGPPAAIDAGVYGFTTGFAPPVRVQATAAPSPSDPSTIFVDTQWNVPVMGAQISQAGENELVLSPQTRCQNGFFVDGMVSRGPGYFLGIPGESFALYCDLTADTPRVFFDVTLRRPPQPGEQTFKELPIPFYGNDQLGEAIFGADAILTY